MRLDPALPGYLALQLTAEDQAYYQQRWQTIMAQLVDFLYGQQYEDAQLSATFTQLELPNLMAYLNQLHEQLQAGQVAPETVTDQAGSIEQLLANLNYPQALAAAVRIRELAAKQLGQWSHAGLKLNGCQLSVL